MAREEQDREDLLAEAVALVERAELAVAGQNDLAVIGFRRDGAASIYFGADPVYHFNSAGELRRAYRGGLLYKAEKGRLAALERRRTDEEVVLARHDLSDTETAGFQRELAGRLATLRTAIDAGQVVVMRQVAPQSDLLTRIRDWLRSLAAGPPIAHSPRAR